MIVPEKPLWGGNKKVCMQVCTNTMNVDDKNSAFSSKINRCS